MQDALFNDLIDFMLKIPGIKKSIGSGVFDNGIWWVKFKIDIKHKLAWHVVQELGCIVNYISLDERLPTIFYPASPAPYLNDGPEDYLSWIIESKTSDFLPNDLKEWLEGRLPDPVDDLTAWETKEE